MMSSMMFEFCHVVVLSIAVPAIVAGDLGLIQGIVVLFDMSRLLFFVHRAL